VPRPAQTALDRAERRRPVTNRRAILIHSRHRRASAQRRQPAARGAKPVDGEHRPAIDSPVVKSYRRSQSMTPSQSANGGKSMQWTTPRIVEIAIGLEINSYACADLA
jgi:coenzyme PQQ precursor peptide PqqA